MLKSIKLPLVLPIVLSGLLGCSSVSPISTEKGISENSLNVSHTELKDLAGVWEYQEGSVITPLTFDQHGNGTYDWKQGKFITDSLENGVWKGMWHQEENDREGGFEMHLDQGLRSATGRWWYTRIEQDRDPLDPGGTFTLHRISDK